MGRRPFERTPSLFSIGDAGGIVSVMLPHVHNTLTSKAVSTCCCGLTIPCTISEANVRPGSWLPAGPGRWRLGDPTSGVQWRFPGTDLATRACIGAKRCKQQLGSPSPGVRQVARKVQAAIGWGRARGPSVHKASRRRDQRRRPVQECPGVVPGDTGCIVQFPGRRLATIALRQRGRAVRFPWRKSNSKNSCSCNKCSRAGTGIAHSIGDT